MVVAPGVLPKTSLKKLTKLLKLFARFMKKYFEKGGNGI